MIIDFFQKIFANRNLNKKLSFIGNCILLVVKAFIFIVFVIRLTKDSGTDDKYLKIIAIGESLLIGFIIFGVSLVLSILSVIKGIKSKANSSLYSAFSLTTAIYAVIVVFYSYKSIVLATKGWIAILFILLVLILLVIQITRVRQINLDKAIEEDKE